MTDWIFAETLPRVDELVMVYIPREPEPDRIWLGYWDGVAWRSDDGFFIYPSHWAKMPEPPPEHTPEPEQPPRKAG